MEETCLVLLRNVRQEERMELGTEGDSISSNISKGQAGSWNEGCGRRGQTVEPSWPSSVAHPVSALADEGHSNMGCRSTNDDIRWSALFYFVVLLKRN